jgi:hypothetical protein
MLRPVTSSPASGNEGPGGLLAVRAGIVVTGEEANPHPFHEEAQMRPSANRNLIQGKIYRTKVGARPNQGSRRSTIRSIKRELHRAGCTCRPDLSNLTGAELQVVKDSGVRYVPHEPWCRLRRRAEP